MPARVIRAEINSSDSLSRVSRDADLTFRCLIVAVDDYGRTDARPAVLKAALFATRREVTETLLMRWIAELAKEGCVQLYEIGGRPYLQLSSWESHRGKTRRAQASRLPAPPQGDLRRSEDSHDNPRISALEVEVEVEVEVEKEKEVEREGEFEGEGAARPSPRPRLTPPRSRPAQARADPCEKRAPPEHAVVLVESFTALRLSVFPHWHLPSEAAARQWAEEADRLIRLDHHGPQEVTELLGWLFNPVRSSGTAAFWAPVIQSIAKLRKHWDQISEQRTREERHNGRDRPSDPIGAAAERIQHDFDEFARERGG